MNLFFLRLVRMLKKNKMTVSTAESCTGGMIAQMITDIEGSSEVFGLGIVSYSIEQKVKALGVDENIINEYGVYSEQTVTQMAQHVRELAGSDISVATSGIAGPDGGTDEMPVGTVFIAVDGKNGTFAERCFFSAESREMVRVLAAQRAADMCMSYIRRMEE